MIRKAVIIILTTLAVGVVLLWASSYWWIIYWCSKPMKQLPNTTVSVAEGICDISRMRHVDDAKFGMGKVARFGGVVVYTLWHRETTPFDLPAGVTIRRWIRPFSQDGSPQWGHYEFASLNNVEDRTVVIRLWLPLVVLATYPTIAFIRGPLLRYRRRRKGLCLKCGYDLTGNVTGVCSECGQPIGEGATA